MSMSSTIVSAIDQAFRAMGDLVGPVTIRSYEETYVPSTGLLTKVTVETETEGVIAEYDAVDIDGEVIQREDRRIFLKHKDGLSIKIGDEMIDVSGVKYVVQDPKQIRPRDVTLLWEVRGRA
jgi:hypothetical protein